jgi:hypothetical protein
VVLYTNQEDTRMPREGNRGVDSAGAPAGGEKAVEICRKLGISEQIFYT